MTNLHVIFTDPGGSSSNTWTAESPQLPHLHAGNPNLDKLMASLPDILLFAGADASATVWRHEQKLATSPEGYEFLIRYWADADADELQLLMSAASRELRAAREGVFDERVHDMPTLALGERLIIAVLREDTVGWVLEQVSPGEGVVVATYAGEDAVWSCTIFDQDAHHRGTPIEKLGITRESTVAELMDATLSSEATELAAHLLAPALQA